MVMLSDAGQARAQRVLAEAARQQAFLADLIRIRSYTGDERAAVDRTLDELRVVGCDDVWMDTAGNALGRVGSGRHLALYDAHLDTNQASDESQWPHPPFEPVVDNGVMWGLGASDCKAGVAAIVYGAGVLRSLRLVRAEICPAALRAAVPCLADAARRHGRHAGLSGGLSAHAGRHGPSAHYCEPGRC